MTAHRGFDDPFPPVHPLPSLPSSRFHLRLRYENTAARLVQELGTQIVGKYPAENRPRARRSFVINVSARFGAEAEPGRSVFLPRIIIEVGELGGG